jgi:hypothetical protein
MAQVDVASSPGCSTRAPPVLSHRRTGRPVAIQLWARVGGSRVRFTVRDRVPVSPHSDQFRISPTIGRSLAEPMHQRRPGRLRAAQAATGGLERPRAGAQGLESLSRLQPIAVGPHRSTRWHRRSIR